MSLPAGFVAAQEPSVRTSVVENREVLVLSSSATAPDGVTSLGGVTVEVSTDQGLRRYRATYEGRTYTAHADLSGPATRFAFDPSQRRFQVVSSAIRVELPDYGDLDEIVLEHGAVSGKAYPQLDFAVIQLDRATDPALVIERLAIDPKVRRASLRFEQAPWRPMIVSRLPGDASTTTGTPVTPSTKESLNADLFISVTNDVRSTDFQINMRIWNFGAGASQTVTLQVALFEFVADDSTSDPDDQMRSAVSEADDIIVPPIDGKGSPYATSLSVPTDALDAGQTYFVEFTVLDGVFFLEGAATLTRQFTGFTLDSENRVQHVCIEPGRGSATGMADPLQPHQWNLNNTGQAGYAESGGTADEDLQMDTVLSDGATGEGVKVAVVDTGLEVCHPDLASSVEDGASYNFNAVVLESESLSPAAFRVESGDPFNYDATGGHGTSVAGVIAAAADNGIGGRGVAPDVQLRGYNMLNSLDQFAAALGSLGASRFSPDSTDVDIFNMSFGGRGSGPVNPDSVSEQLFSHGTRQLRSGLGAIYIKAAGNDFSDCASLSRSENDTLGCASSNGDEWNNLPYLIIAGAFNADGKKSSYASAGSNLWISAPGGEYGRNKPALISVDQMGWDRGNGVLFGGSAPLDDEASVNPDGDYTALMNGTSAAAPNVSGAVAVLLEEAPELTWRDVRHILARTARRIDPDIEAVEGTFNMTTRTLRLAWTENTAGYAYHNWYGFGALDLDAAVEFAGTYAPDSLGEFRQSGWFESGTTVDIPDNDATGVTQVLNVSGLSADANIEAVALEIDIDHPFPHDLGIHLVSPGGTRSVVNQVFNETLAVEDLGDFKWWLLSNAFYGENPNGNWQIEVFDAAADDTGSLDAWRLRFYYGEHPEEEEETTEGDTTEGDSPGESSGDS